jgi:Flp pilus assembly protein TadG
MKMSLNDTRGASAVELAIILPVLLVILFGIIEFGIYMYNKQMLTNAAREGARAGIVAYTTRLTPAEILDVVQESFQNAITFGAENDVVLVGTPDGYASDADTGVTLTVTVKYDYDFLVLPNFLGDWLQDKLGEMTATAAMRYE